MKKSLGLLCFIFIMSATEAQVLRQVSLENSGNGEIISFLIDEAVIVNISKEGNIIDWGIENNSIYNYQAKLDQYMGRVEYYSANENEFYRGKVKYIGRTAFAYYTAGENDAFKGKLKMIGTVPFSYYTPFDDENYRGKIKIAGAVSFAYYGSTDNEAYRGKLKMAGPTNLQYYASYDDKAFAGKIKRIGQASFTYYSSYDRREYRGAMKTGNRTPYINGIKYYVRY